MQGDAGGCKEVPCTAVGMHGDAAGMQEDDVMGMKGDAWGMQEDAVGM